ncbi:MAG TPA: glycosyltransferase [Flavisolibacter sp.]|nr:glycosyltransferase [Flavisolibacter sp.]
MSVPLVSIVLPTYNGSRYIQQSIESCLAQTFKDFELIIVNDCSTDNTPEIINEYSLKDSRIIVINNEFNKKLPLSLNTGFEKAKGKYFTWTSDDNYYAPNALEKMVEVLENNSSVDLVYSDYYIIDENNNITGKRIFGDVYESFFKWLGAGACFLYRREIHFANNGYNPAAFLIEDYDFFVRAYIRFNFFYLHTPDLYYYREHGASLTATQNFTINFISKIFLERNLSGLEKKLSPKEIALVYRKLAVYYAVNMNNQGKYKEYLNKLRPLSLKHVTTTVFYVVLKKTIHTLTIGFTGILHLFKLIFKQRA